MRLLVATLDAEGALQPIERHIRVTRLGQGVDDTKCLHPDAIARTVAVLADYRAIWDGFSVPEQMVVLMATSAVRDAVNADVFTQAAVDACGIAPQVISGSLEGEIAFLGATADQPPIPILVIDIGGGSTEFVLGDASGEIIASTSEQLGCVRLTERTGQPPYADGTITRARAGARAVINEAASVLPTPIDPATRLIGVAGTVSTLAALDLDLDQYEADRIHGTAVSKAAVAHWVSVLAAMDATRIEALGPVEGNRGDVMPIGAIILDEIMDVFGFDEVIASEHDSLDGMCFKLLTGNRPAAIR